MWMSVLRKEVGGYNAGTMFRVVRSHPNVINAYYLTFDSDTPRIDNGRAVLCTDVIKARELFTKPTKDVGSLMNESINITEATYC